MASATPKVLVRRIPRPNYLSQDVNKALMPWNTSTSANLGLVKISPPITCARGIHNVQRKGFVNLKERALV